MNMVELCGIRKEYTVAGGGSFMALDDINAVFAQGELVSLIGESGSGKSTLMNVIGGLDTHYSGSILAEGENISEYTENELDSYRKQKIGFVFQSFNLIPHLTVLDNVALAMAISDISRNERVNRAVTLLRQVGLESQLNKKPDQLSGGQKQRVAIARALMNDPDTILADEPTGALDEETSEQILTIFKEIAERGKLVIIVTHSEKVAAKSSRIIEISDGKIIRDSGTATRGPGKMHVSGPNQRKEKKQHLSFLSAVRLALLNMREKLGRNIWVSFGTGIGIMSVVLMLSLGNGMKDYFRESMNSMLNPLVIEVNMPKEMPKTDEEFDFDSPPDHMLDLMGLRTPFGEKDIERLSSIHNVVSVERAFNLFSFGTNTVKYKDRQSSIMMLGTVSSNLAESNIKEGTFPKRNEVLLTERTADELGGGLVGEMVTLSVYVNEQVLTGQFKVSGITATEDVSAPPMEMTYVNYEDLKQLAEENAFDFAPTTVYLVTDDEDHVDSIKTNVKKLGFSGSTSEAMSAIFAEMLDTLTIVLAGVSAVSLLVSAIMILVVLHISVSERNKEIGILKAIGARRKDIKRIFVSESFLLGVASGIFGIVMASIIALAANSISERHLDVPMVIMDPAYILFGLAISVLISMLAGILPAGKAAKLDPVESLRR